MTGALAGVGADALSTALTALVSAAVGALVAAAGRARAARRDERGLDRAIGDGVRSLLRCELVRQHREHCIRGEPMTLEDREYVERTYESYHALGGNGTGTRIYEELMDLDLGRQRN